MLMVESTTSIASGGYYVIFYFAYFLTYFQFGLKDLFSGMWAYLYNNIVVSFPGFVQYLNLAVMSSPFSVISGF